MQNDRRQVLKAEDPFTTHEVCNVRKGNAYKVAARRSRAWEWGEGRRALVNADKAEKRASPNPRSLRILVIGLVLGLLFQSQEAWAGLESKDPIRISGVLFDGRQRGDPEPEESIRLTNNLSNKIVDISDYKLSDRFGPRRQRGSDDRSLVDGEAAGGANTLMLPSGAEIPAGGDIWLAYKATGFKATFGFNPNFEAVDTDPMVPNLRTINGWPNLFAKHGVLSLHDRSGSLIDVVAYDLSPNKPMDLASLPPSAWHGPAVQLKDAAIFGWKGQVLARDRDEAGHLLVDSDTAADWDSGFSAKQLGVEPTHRLELPGQSHFRSQPLRGVMSTVRCSSAPENNFSALAEAFDSAQKSIRVSVYKFTNDLLADHLLKALERGVKVTIWTEGSPVGGLEDQSRYILDRLHQAGAKVYFLVRAEDKQTGSRYRFDHSKYSIIDERLAIIGTENYGRTGHPADPSFGNRGWEIHIEQADFVQQLLDVWNTDCVPGYSDVRSIDARSDDTYGRPYKNPNFKADRTLIRGNYARRAKVLEVKEPMDLELVLSPDTSLNENSALLGLIASAKKELIVLQNSIPLHWGKRKDSMQRAPNLPLSAVVAAARRGVKTRVLVDGAWYNVEARDDRDNDDTVDYLNDLARSEKLDLQAKVINLATTGVEKIHAKGLIVDAERTLVSSINWSENSFKGNREVGVVLKSRKVAKYYRDIFYADWRRSRLYRVEVLTRRGRVQAAPGSGKRLRRLARGENLEVIAEVGGSAGRGPAYLEVALPHQRRGFVSVKGLSKPIFSPEEAALNIGRSGRVEGRVLRTEVGDKVIRLHFTHRSGFVGVIFVHQSEQFIRAGFDPAHAFTGKRVSISGVLRVYGVPEIIIKSPKQVRILDEQ